MQLSLVTSFLLVNLIGLVAALTCPATSFNPATQRFHPLWADVISPLRASVVSIQIHRGSVRADALWDAWAPYTASALGRFTDADALRRPVAERTFLNKNLAMAYATFRVSLAQFPASASVLRTAFCSQFGLDPDDTNVDPNNARGLGNYVAAAVLAARYADGSNWLGDGNGRVFNRRLYNFTSTTSYRPVNSFYRVVDADRWQPNLEWSSGTDMREYEQHFITPQMGYVPTFAGFDPAAVVFDPPSRLYQNDRAGYRAKAQEVLDASAALTEEQKLLSEFFDDKVTNVPELSRRLLSQPTLIDNIPKLQSLLHNALFDALVATWHHKAKFDAVRPFTAINVAFGEQVLSAASPNAAAQSVGGPSLPETIHAWAGPGLGAQDMRPQDWRSYVRTDGHPEHPSGTTCLLHAWAEAARNRYGPNGYSDAYTFSQTLAAGSSVVEPGFTPANPLTIGFSSLTEVAHKAGESRLWGGVHFREAIEAGKSPCTAIGLLWFQKYQALLNGEPYLDNRV